MPPAQSARRRSASSPRLGRLAAGLGLGLALVTSSCGTSPPGAASPVPTAAETSAGPRATTGSPTAGAPSAGPPTSPAGTPTSPAGPVSASTAPATPRCAALTARLGLRDQVGQLFMVGVPSSGLSSETADVLAATRTGSVIFLGDTTAGVGGVRALARYVRSETPRPAGVRTLLAADQEGGTVQRLKGDGFADLPSARTQGGWPASRLERSAAGWADELAGADLDANLAPVADVVATGMRDENQPIGVLRRDFGSDPRVVAEHVGAFVTGMDRGGIATAVKHFPGLGHVRGNTDLVTRAVDSTTTRDDEELAGFRAAVRAGVDMVMISSAYYTRIDADRRAAYSSTVIGGMLRRDLRFSGVVISDDLAAPGTRDLKPGTRALRFLRAGGDLAIVGDPAQARAMTEAVRAEAERDDRFRAAVAESVRRVLVVKAERGLADC